MPRRKTPQRQQVVLHHPPETPLEKRAREDAARLEADRREAEYHRTLLNPHHEETHDDRRDP